MSIEVIPEAFQAPFDPLVDVDHDLVASYSEGRILTGQGARRELQRAFRFNHYCGRLLIERLINYGKFLEPYDEELESIDPEQMRIRTFNAGTALALVVVSNMAYELDIDQQEWRDHWIGLPEHIDAPLNMTINRTSSSDDCFKIGAAILDVGYRTLANVEQPYRSVIDTITDEYAAGSEHVNVFRGSYGYVLGVGRKVVRDIAFVQSVEAQVSEVFPDGSDSGKAGHFDREYEALVVSEGRDV